MTKEIYRGSLIDFMPFRGACFVESVSQINFIRSLSVNTAIGFKICVPVKGNGLIAIFKLNAIDFENNFFAWSTKKTQRFVPLIWIVPKQGDQSGKNFVSSNHCMSADELRGDYLNSFKPNYSSLMGNVLRSRRMVSIQGLVQRRNGYTNLWRAFSQRYLLRIWRIPVAKNSELRLTICMLTSFPALQKAIFVLLFASIG